MTSMGGYVRPCVSRHQSRRFFAYLSLFSVCCFPPFQSVAVGVGKFGEQEQSVPLVVSPKATGSQSEGQHSVTKRLQRGSHSPPRPGSIGPDSRGVFPENKARAKYLNDADELSAEARLRDVTVAACCRVFLARVAATDKVNVPAWMMLAVGIDSPIGVPRFKVRALFFRAVMGVSSVPSAKAVIATITFRPGCRREGSRVIPSPDVGPVSFEDSSAILIDFHLPDALHPGSFKAKVKLKATDSGEQTAKSQ